jgi:alpha/beta superfamily hydrolase
MPTIFRAFIASLLVLCTFSFQSAFGQDYAREKRWAQEVKQGLVTGESVMIKEQRGPEFLGIYTQVQHPVATVVLVHGLGVHPDHGIIGDLRTRLADLGYNTLAIQMPVLAADAPQADYTKVMPDATKRIRAAAKWLTDHGQTNLVLVSHSMGSKMADFYFATTAQNGGQQPFHAWVAMGLGQAYTDVNGKYPFPMLDVYAENDLPAVLAKASERRTQLNAANGSHQVEIGKTDHFYAGQEKALVSQIDQFLRGSTVAKN